MKKILLIVSSTLLLANSFVAQDDADKKFRFGLKITPTPTWLRSTDTKSVEKASTKFGFGFGLQMEFRINSTASFVTGIGGDFLGGKQNYKKGQGYILNESNAYTDSKNTEFSSALSNTATVTASKNKFYELNSRNIKATYVTIPVLLKLMTKDISGFKYFGMFGGNIAIQSKFRATDNVTEITSSTTNSVTTYVKSSNTINIEDMRPSGDLVPINVGLNAGIGAEYNLSGNTSVFLSINYLRGFINQYQPKSDIMVDDLVKKLNEAALLPAGTPAITPERSKQSAYVDGLQINIGILF